MGVLLNRHTFKYLDLPKTDKKFEEFDVSSYMIEGKIKNKLGRAVYRSARALAIAVEMIAFAALSALRLSIKGGKSLKSFSKKTILMFIKSPLIVRKRFSPSKADRLELRTAALNNALKTKKSINKAIVGEGKYELSHDEKKELMDNWYQETVGGAHDQPLKEIKSQLDKLANRDISEVEVEEVKSSIDKILENPDNTALFRRFSGFKFVVNAFEQVFDSQKDAEDKISSEDVKKDYSLFLKYPNLLKREDLASLVNSAPFSIKKQLLTKKQEVAQRTLTHFHKKELELLKLFETLKPTTKEDLELKYTSEEEKRYLKERLALVKDWQTKTNPGSFEHTYYSFEVKALEEQQKASQKADGNVVQVTQKIHNLNREIKGSLKLVREAITQRISNGLQILGKIDRSEEIKKASDAEFLNLAKEVIQDLQKEELKLSKEAFKEPSYLQKFKQSLAEYGKQAEHIKTTQKESVLWKNLNEMQTVDERNEERENRFANDVIRLSMEKKAECQLPLIISKYDARSMSSGDLPKRTNPEKSASDKIHNAAIDFVEKVQKKHLEVFKTRITPYTDYAAALQNKNGIGDIKSVAKIAAKEEKERLDFDSLSRELNLAEDIHQWNQRLQEIFVGHMEEIELEEKMEACSSKEEANRVMADCFEVWLEKITGQKMSPSLKFDHLKFPNNQKARDEATAKLAANKEFKRGYKKSGEDVVGGFLAFAEKIHQKIEDRKKAQEKSNEVGLTTDLIGKGVVEVDRSSLSIKLPDFQALHGKTIAIEDFVEALERIRNNLIGSTDQERQVEWVKALVNTPRFKESKIAKFMIISACRDLINLGFDQKQPIDDEIKTIFLNQFKDKDQFEFNKMTNSERGGFLSLYLKMLFCENKQVAVVEKERSHLIQLIELSGLQFAEKESLKGLIQLGGSSTEATIEEVGLALQGTSIGLEGVEESILVKSYQLSTLKEDTKTRALLDACRAVAAHAHSADLLSYVFDHYKEEHDQGREAIERALIHAHAYEPQAVKDFIKTKIVGSDSWDPKTMAPSSSIFYKDLLAKLDPSQVHDDTAFNQSLIDSKRVPEMLMGYARFIKSYSAKDLNDPETFYKLLKYKVAYQEILFNFFEGKKEIDGFLKVATDKALLAMIERDHEISDMLKDTDFIDKITEAFENDKDSDHETKLIKRELKTTSGDRKFSQTVIPQIISFGTRIKIDAVTGVLYKDGKQQIALPGDLQAHPAILSLNIEGYPYDWDATLQAFVYYTKQGAHSTPQIIIKKSGDQLIVQKKLTTDFNKPEQKELQFVEKETILMPLSVFHRMGIQSFWQDERGVVYGYNKEGELICRLTKGDPWTVQTKEGSYRFMSNVVYKIQETLLKSISPNEILESLDGNHYFVPSLGLKLHKETTLGKKVNFWSTPKETTQWAAERAGMPKKVLDLNSDLSCLVFKNSVNEEKRRAMETKLKELNYRKEIKTLEGRSHLGKNEIRELEKRIANIENQLIEFEEKTFLAPLSDDAHGKDLDKIKMLIPANLQDEFIENFDGYEAEYVNYEIYFAALKFMNNKLIESIAGTDQKQIDLYVTVYKEILDQYQACCDKPVEAVLFYESTKASIATRDLQAALAITLKGIEGDADPLLLVKNLAKYRIDAPLKKTEIRLLNQAIDLYQGKGDKINPNLETMLNLIRYLDLSYRVQDLSHTPLSDKKKKVQELQDRYKASKDDIENKLKGLKERPSLEVIALWRKTGLLSEHNYLQEAALLKGQVERKEKPVVAEEFQYLGARSLLERLGVSHAITSCHKDADQLLSKQQKPLIKEFQKHSPDQVIGFYLEELGQFKLDGLYQEFGIDPKTKRGLYGLNEKELQKVFTFLEKEGYIEQIPSSTYYRVKSIEKATTAFLMNEIRAQLTHLPLSQKQLNQAIGRLESFLFRAMQSGFEIKFKNKEFEAEVREKLAEEKKTHLQIQLESEAILKSELAQFGASMVDLKYAILSQDYTKFSKNGVANNQEMVRLSNAMIRHLFHKTEVQHIENIEKAPLVGERNMVELLLTKRNYPVDLLLKEQLTDDERKEQIMQRAFLAFEEDYGNRCNVLQIKMFRSLILDTNHEEAIDAAQARMGFGKTALLPLMSITRVALERTYNEEDKHLVRYVVPKAVLKDNASSFNQRFSAIAGGNVLEDREFSRYQIDAKDPKSSFEYIILDLTARLHFYEDAKKRGNVLIQWPEIRGSMEAQDLDFGEMIKDGKLLPDVVPLCLQAKKLLAQIRSIPTYTVFDELDDTQDIKSREVNFTRGEKRELPRETIRPLQQLISKIEKEKDKNWKDLPKRAEELVKELCTNRDGSAITTVSKEVIKYLTERETSINNEMKDLLSQNLADHLDDQAVHTENDSMFFLIRAVLLDENILALIQSKQPRTHFGARFEEKGEREFTIMIATLIQLF